MKSIQFIRYTFEARASEPISQELQEFYRWIASSLSEEECTLAVGRQMLSVPSVAEIGGVGHESISEQINNYIRNQWKKPIEVAIFDIARSTPTVTIRSEWEMGIASAVVTQITEALSRNEKPLCIIKIRARPKENDIVWNVLQYFFDAKYALIIDDVGLTRGHSHFEGLFNSDEYRTQLLRARNTPIDLLELKLIRRLGHIRIEKRDQRDQQAYCVRHFFDGSECKDEIAQLIREYIAEYYDESNIPIILYADTKPHWLRDIVLTLQDCSFESPMSVGDFFRDYQSNPKEIKVPPLLVLPVIDTARTLHSIMVDWAVTELPRPKILSIISTHAEQTTDGEKIRKGTWRPKFNGEEYEVDYLLHRKRKKYTTTGQCPMCRLEIPHQTSGLADKYLSLTTYDFWDMVGNKQCTPEKQIETPTHRKDSLNTVPPIEDMVHENGPWLAKKAINLLEYHIDKCRLKGIPIVYLQESGAKPLPLYLRELLGATLIELPNWVRNELSDNPTRVNEVHIRLQQERPECTQQLDSVNPDQPALILEEFSVSGGTRNAIMRLLHHLGRTVLAHLCVLSFEPPQSRLAMKNSFCLYEFEIPKGWLNYG